MKVKKKIANDFCEWLLDSVMGGYGYEEERWPGGDFVSMSSKITWTSAYRKSGRDKRRERERLERETLGGCVAEKKPNRNRKPAK